MSSLPVKAREMIAAKSKTISELKGSAVPRAAGNAGVMLTGAAAGGALDEYLGDVGGMQVSTGTGLVVGTLGVVTKSPKAIYAAAGFLSDMARELGRQAVQRFAGAADDEAEQP